MTLSFILSQKNQKLLNLNKYIYTVHRSNKDSINWKCVKNKSNACNATVTTSSMSKSGKY